MSQKEEELAALHKQQKISRKGRITRDSRDRLKRITSKKFRTCFISALSEFENMFGSQLWGHQLKDDEITESHRVNKIKWEKVRKEILDKGNAQSRALCMEMDLHYIEFEGYHVDFGGIRDEK